MQPLQASTSITAAALPAVHPTVIQPRAAVGGGRAKARTALAAGAVKIGGVDFALFLGHQLLEGASIFDRQHYNDYQKFKLIANEGDETVQAALALLKENPDKDKEKEVKKLDAAIKAAVKKNS